MSNEGFLVVSKGEDPIKVKQKDGSKRDIFWPGALLARETWMKHVRVMSVSSISLLQLFSR